MIDIKELKGRGRSLYLAVDKSNFSKKEAAERAGFKDNTFYTHIRKEDLSYAILAKYGSAINYDFATEYPEMDEYYPHNLTNKSQTQTDNKEYLQLLDKYLKLLESYKALQEKFSEMQAENYELKNRKSS